MKFQDDSIDLYGGAQMARSRYPSIPAIEYVRAGQAWLNAHPKRQAVAAEKEDFFRLNHRLYRHLVWWGFSETARRGGYQPEDIYFYNLDVIENVLPGLWDDNYTGLPEQYEEVRQKRDAAEGNNWPALLGDVSVAFARASVWSRDLLFGHFALGVPTDSVDVDTALRELRDLLGGARPQGCPRECEECGYGASTEVS